MPSTINTTHLRLRAEAADDALKAGSGLAISGRRQAELYADLPPAVVLELVSTFDLVQKIKEAAAFYCECGSFIDYKAMWDALNMLCPKFGEARRRAARAGFGD